MTTPTMQLQVIQTARTNITILPTITSATPSPVLFAMQRQMQASHQYMEFAWNINAMEQALTLDLPANNSILQAVPNDTIDFMTHACLTRQILQQEDIVSTDEMLDLHGQPHEDSDDDAIDMNIHILSQAELDDVDLEGPESIAREVDHPFILLILAN